MRPLRAPSDNPTPAWEAICAALRAECAKRAEAAAQDAAREAEEKRESDALIAAVLEAPVDGLTKAYNAYYGTIERVTSLSPLYRYRVIMWSDPRLDAKRAEVDAFVSAHNERVKQESEAKEARDEAERLEREGRYATAVSEFVTVHCTANQQSRHAEGLLPEVELLTAIRDHAFAQLADFVRYSRLRASDLDHTADDCESRFDAQPLTALTAGEFETLAAIRDSAPEGSAVEPRVHSAWCTSDTCEARTVTRHSIKATIDWHGREFSREFAL